MSFFNKIHTLVKQIKDISVIKRSIEAQNILSSRLLNHHNFELEPSSLYKDASNLEGTPVLRAGVSIFREVEYKVFSQFGDDGIIQYLVHKLSIEPKTFVEFGVENYVESNTRLLLTKDNWKGLVMDGSDSHVAYIKQDEIYWRHELCAVSAFITKENINKLLLDNGFDGELGILSIDIDGNDYWVWKEITVARPVLVIVEYNSVFGADRAITIPYQEDFTRSSAHYSHVYWGASLSALCHLAEEKGYYFVGSNSAGNNAYFVRKDKIGALKPLKAHEGYVASAFRDSRDRNGSLSFVGGEKRIELIKGMPVYNVLTGHMETI